MHTKTHTPCGQCITWKIFDWESEIRTHLAASRKKKIKNEQKSTAKRQSIDGNCYSRIGRYFFRLRALFCFGFAYSLLHAHKHKNTHTHFLFNLSLLIHPLLRCASFRCFILTAVTCFSCYYCLPATSGWLLGRKI